MKTLFWWYVKEEPVSYAELWIKIKGTMLYKNQGFHSIKILRCPIFWLDLYFKQKTKYFKIGNYKIPAPGSK